MKFIKKFNEGYHDYEQHKQNQDMSNNIVTVLMDSAVETDGHQITGDENGEPDMTLRNAMQRLNIEHRVINPHGPAGGWPEIEYKGKLSDMKKFLHFFDAMARNEEDLGVALADWTGDQEELDNIIN